MNSVKFFKERKERLSRLRISSKTNLLLVQDFVTIIEEFKQDYKAEFLIKDLIDYDYKSARNKRIEQIKKVKGEIHYDALNEDHLFRRLIQEENDKKEIFARIKAVGSKYLISEFSSLLKLLKILVDIKDFALGGALKEISESNSFEFYYIESLAKLVYSNDENLYIKRFYKSEYFIEDVFLIAEAVIKGKVTEYSFENLINPQLQDLLQEYRKKRQAPFGNSLFRLAGFDIDFTRWLHNLKKQKIDQILEKYRKKLSINDILILCSRINRDLEILKFVVFSLIKTTKKYIDISKITGKSELFIKKYAKLIYELKVT